MIQEDRRMKINGKVIAVAAMLAVAGIGGTFAYFNQTPTYLIQGNMIRNWLKSLSLRRARTGGLEPV